MAERACQSWHSGRGILFWNFCFRDLAFWQGEKRTSGTDGNHAFYYLLYRAQFFLLSADHLHPDHIYPDGCRRIDHSIWKNKKMIWKKKTQAFVFTGIFYYFLLYEKADCSKMNSPQSLLLRHSYRSTVHSHNDKPECSALF